MRRFVLVAVGLAGIACTSGTSSEELWAQACARGPAVADASARDLAWAEEQAAECRAGFARMAESDRRLTNRVARCAIQTRDRGPAELDEVLACLPESQREPALSLIEASERELANEPEDVLASLERMVEPPPPPPKTTESGEALLEASPIRGRPLAYSICGEVPTRSKPYELYVRASMRRSQCREDMARLARHDRRAAELIAVCVDALVEDAPAERPDADALRECLPVNVHERVDSFMDDARGWGRISSTQLNEVVAALEAEDSARLEHEVVD